MSGPHVIPYISLLDTLFDASEEFAGPIRDHSEEFTTSQAIVTDSYTTVPNAYNYHNVANVHLLKDSKELIAGSILAIVIKALCQDLFLLNRVDLTHPVGKNAIFSRCKFRAGLWVGDVTEVIYNETHLILMGNRCAKGLELQLFVLLAFTASYALNDRFKLFLIQIGGR